MDTLLLKFQFEFLHLGFMSFEDNDDGKKMDLFSFDRSKSKSQKTLLLDWISGKAASSFKKLNMW